MKASMSKTDLIESIVESTKTKSNKEFSKNDVSSILEEFFHCREEVGFFSWLQTKRYTLPTER